MTGRLFEISFSHSYFSDGMLGGAVLSPDPATQALIARYSLLVSSTSTGWALSTLGRQDPAVLLSYLHGQWPGTALVFWLICDEVRFAAVTDLPLGWAGQLEMSSKAGERKNGAVCIAPVRTERSVPNNGVVGVVRIYLEDLLANGGMNSRYTVAFYARSLHWLYYLVNRGQIKLENPVIGVRGGFVFDGPREIVLADGEKALCFSSGDVAFPLQQLPTIMFDLIDGTPPKSADGQHAERCLMKGLPTPGERQMEVRRENGRAYVFSAMHVYL